LRGRRWMMSDMKMTRVWAMPSPNTFSIKPIANLLDAWISHGDVVIDPFARSSRRGTITNDLDPSCGCDYSMLAEDFVQVLEPLGSDVVLFDPPYSPRQISECYKGVGRTPTGRDTQNARLYKAVRDGLDASLKSGGIAISFGWNSGGFGKSRGYVIEEILLVAHGGAHNDTICVVERKI